MSKYYALAAVTVAALGIGGMAGYAFFGQRGDDPLAGCRAGQTGGADIGGPFNLVNKDGQTVTEKDVLKRPTLVYFGYTFCPDVCPMDMARNAEVADILEEKGQDLDLVFITVDPKRDTPQVVGEFSEMIHPRAMGLTGSTEQIDAAVRAYRAYYKLHEDGSDYYLVDHSAFTYLMLPGIGFADFYRNGVAADEVANGVSCMIEASS